MYRIGKYLLWLFLVGTAFAQGGQTNQDFAPTQTGLNLGHTNQRWNGYFQNLDISGSCTVNGLPCLSNPVAGNGGVTGITGGNPVTFTNPLTFASGLGPNSQISGPPDNPFIISSSNGNTLKLLGSPLMLAGGSCTTPVNQFVGQSTTTGFGWTGTSTDPMTFCSNGLTTGAANAGGFAVRSLGVFAFSSTALATGSADTGLSRDSAGVIDIGNGTQGDKSGGLNLTTLTVTGHTTVATPTLSTDAVTKNYTDTTFLPIANGTATGTLTANNLTVNGTCTGCVSAGTGNMIKANVNTMASTGTIDFTATSENGGIVVPNTTAHTCTTDATLCFDTTLHHLFGGSNGSAVDLMAGGTGTVTHTAGALTLGNVIVGNGGADVKDGGTALTALAPLASPTFTGTTTNANETTTGSFNLTGTFTGQFQSNGGGLTIVRTAGSDICATIAAALLAGESGGTNGPIVDTSAVGGSSENCHSDMFTNSSIGSFTEPWGIVKLGGYTLNVDAPISVPTKTSLIGVNRGDTNGSNTSITGSTTPSTGFHALYPSHIVAPGAHSTICVRVSGGASTMRVIRAGSWNGSSCTVDNTGPLFSSGLSLLPGYAIEVCPNTVAPVPDSCVPIGVIKSVDSDSQITMERDAYAPFTDGTYQVAFVAPLIKYGVQGTGQSGTTCDAANGAITNCISFEQTISRMNIDCGDTNDTTDMHIAVLNMNAQELSELTYVGIQNCRWAPIQVVSSQTHNFGPVCHVTIGGSGNSNTGPTLFWNTGQTVREVCDITNVQGNSGPAAFEYVNAMPGTQPSFIAWGLHNETCVDAVKIGNTTSWSFASNGYGGQNAVFSNITGNGSGVTNAVHFANAGTVGAGTRSTAVCLIGGVGANAGSAKVIKDDYFTPANQLATTVGNYCTGPNGTVAGSPGGTPVGESGADFCPSTYLRLDGADATTFYVSNCSDNLWHAH